MSNREVGFAFPHLLVLAPFVVMVVFPWLVGGGITRTELVTEVPGLILFVRCFGGLHGTSLSPGGGVQGTSFLTVDDGPTVVTVGPSSTFFDTRRGLEAATGGGRGCSVSTGLGEFLFLGGRPRPRLGVVAVVGSADDSLVGTLQVEEAGLLLRESLSEVSESELTLNL